MTHIGDLNRRNRHQHLKVVTNTSRLQHRSPTPILGSQILGLVPNMIYLYYILYIIHLSDTSNYKSLY